MSVTCPCALRLCVRMPSYDSFEMQRMSCMEHANVRAEYWEFLHIHMHTHTLMPDVTHPCSVFILAQTLYLLPARHFCNTQTHMHIQLDTTLVLHQPLRELSCACYQQRRPLRLHVSLRPRLWSYLLRLRPAIGQLRDKYLPLISLSLNAIKFTRTAWCQVLATWARGSTRAFSRLENALKCR
jgi:hypothetical protein